MRYSNDSKRRTIELIAQKRPNAARFLASSCQSSLLAENVPDNFVNDENQYADDKTADFIRRTYGAGDGPLIGIFYDKQYWSHVGSDLPDILRGHGYSILFMALGNGPDWCLPVDRALIEKMDFIDAYIGTRLPEWLIKAGDNRRLAPAVNLHRTARTFFDGTGGEGRVANVLMLRWGEYVAVPVTTESLSRRTLVLNSVCLPKGVIGTRRHTYVLPLVPNKITRIARIRKNLKEEERDHILVCPSVSNLSAYFIDKYGTRLIEGLLQRYPEYTVVFRPRPEDRENAEVRDLCEIGRRYGNFVFDDNEDYCKRYAHGVVLITDRSSTGQTFALATHQPSISFPADGRSDGISVKKLRSVGCFKVHTLEEVFDKVDDVIADPCGSRPAIREIYNELFSNSYEFSERFPEYLHSIINDEKSGDWYYVKLPEENVTADDADGYEKSICSLVENSLIHVDLYGFDVVSPYLDKKKKSGESVPDQLIEKVTRAYVKDFLYGHSTWNVVSRPLRMILHNVNCERVSETVVAAFDECAEAIIERDKNEVREAMQREVDAIPWAERRWLRAINEKRKRLGQAGHVESGTGGG